MARFVAMAREESERQCHHTLAACEWEMTLDAWPSGRVLALPYPPLRGVSAIAYTAEDGSTASMTLTDVIVDTASRPGRIALKAGISWPSVTLQAIGGVRITFTAGFHASLLITDSQATIDAARALVPMTAQQAMLLLVGEAYENREDSIASPGLSAAVQVPHAAHVLLGQLRAGVTPGVA